MKRVISILILLVASFMAFAQNGIVLPQKPNTPAYIDYSTKETGYWFSVSGEFGSALGTAIYSQLEFFNGYRFSEFLKVGGGISPKVYFSSSVNHQVALPIFAGAQGNIISQYHRMWAPCWNAKLGYSIGENVFSTVGIGIRCGGIRHNFVAFLNYNIQANVAGTETLGHLFGIKLGYEF